MSAESALIIRISAIAIVLGIAGEKPFRAVHYKLTIGS